MLNFEQMAKRDCKNTSNTCHCKPDTTNIKEHLILEKIYQIFNYYK